MKYIELQFEEIENLLWINMKKTLKERSLHGKSFILNFTDFWTQNILFIIRRSLSSKVQLEFKRMGEKAQDFHTASWWKETLR